MQRYWVLCNRCGKKVEIKKERMGDIGKLIGYQLKTYNCPLCGNVLK